MGNGNDFSYKYIPGEPRILIQGNWQELQRYLDEHPGSHVVRGGNGSWIVEQSPQIYVRNSATDETVTNPRDFIRNRYGCKLVNKKKVDQLVQDLNAGNVSWDNLKKNSQ